MICLRRIVKIHFFVRFGFYLWLLSFSSKSGFLFFLDSLRYQVLAYPLHKKVPGDAATCGKILTKSKLENWLLGRTKVFLKYYHVEELARLLELHRRKIVTLQTGWFVFQAHAWYFCNKTSSTVSKLLSFVVIECYAPLLLVKVSSIKPLFYFQ